MLKEQAERTPAPQWVRVVGGWTEFQFAERRMPTLDEINAVAPDTPVFVMHLYDRALLNGTALRAVGYTKDTPDPPASEIQRDKRGNPTGLVVAKPNANILYSTLAKGPKLSREDLINSSRHFFRELNRFGSPVLSMPAAVFRIILMITRSLTSSIGMANYRFAWPTTPSLKNRSRNLLTSRIGQKLPDPAKAMTSTA
jgi:predicted amidohydrolase YtcJ